MADFMRSFEITIKNEDGYSNDPNDVGGETYKGISRRFNPSWEGWSIINKLKKSNLENYEILQNKVKSFYEFMYWDRIQGDLIPNQEIANELFDNAVNLGVHKSVLFLQESLNLLNRNQKNYGDILEDGLIGNKTLWTLKKYLSIDEPSILIKVMNILQGNHYINYMRKSPVQERFARGWLRRVKL